jgi:hypothetical protein
LVGKLTPRNLVLLATRLGRQIGGASG